MLLFLLPQCAEDVFTNMTRVLAECTSTVYNGALSPPPQGFPSLPRSCNANAISPTALFAFDASSYNRTITVSTCSLGNNWDTVLHIYQYDSECRRPPCLYALAEQPYIRLRLLVANEWLQVRPCVPVCSYLSPMLLHAGVNKVFTRILCQGEWLLAAHLWAASCSLAHHHHA